MASYRRDYWLRCRNPGLKDEIIRIARQPIRKLGRHERFIMPALWAGAYGLPREHIVQAVCAALRYRHPGDEQSAAVDKNDRVQWAGERGRHGQALPNNAVFAANCPRAGGNLNVPALPYRQQRKTVIDGLPGDAAIGGAQHSAVLARQAVVVLPILTRLQGRAVRNGPALVPIAEHEAFDGFWDPMFAFAAGGR